MMTSNAAARRRRRKALAVRFAGRDAAVAGKPVTDNPYVVGDTRYLLWVSGYYFGSTKQ